MAAVSSVLFMRDGREVGISSAWRPNGCDGCLWR
jgi:hypothetical protein